MTDNVPVQHRVIAYRQSRNWAKQYNGSGASIPPNSLSQFPFPSLPSPRERFSSPSGSWQSPAAKRYLVNFRLKISPLVATNKCIKLMHFPLSFCKNASPYFFHGAFAPSFIWSIDAPDILSTCLRV